VVESDSAADEINRRSVFALPHEIDRAGVRAELLNRALVRLAPKAKGAALDGNQLCAR
jgi:hypothetical protein